MTTPSHDTLDLLLRRLEGGVGLRAVDLGTTLDQLRWAVARALDADRATLYLLDPVRQALVSRSADLKEGGSIVLALGEGLAGEVARSGRPARLGARDAPTAAARRAEAQTGYRTRSMIAVPLRSEGSTIGVLQVLNKRGGDFVDADERALVALAPRLVLLLQRTSLGGQLEGRTHQSLAFHFNQVVGDAPSMRALYDLVGRAGRSDITVLLLGASGTGKTLLAHALHDNSKRAEGPFVVVDCAAIPDALIENELYGHVAGAYTGAEKSADGKVAMAEGGTLFLDEVGELSLSSQRKLLRLLQDRTYYPVGATQPRTADVRFVVATNRDLAADVAAGTFRHDLLHRLRVVSLRMPTLAERGPEDLDRLAAHYLYVHSRTHDLPDARLSPSARRKLHAYDWPGNVRELRNVLEAAVALATSPVLEPDDLRLLGDTPPSGPAANTFVVDATLPLREVSDRYAGWVLARCGGNRSHAARVLGISRNTLLDALSRQEMSADPSPTE